MPVGASASSTRGPVPLIIHQTAPDDRSRWDPRWESCHRTWKEVCPQPRFRHFFWDDAGLRALVAEAFPEHLATYDECEHHPHRVDFARAAMLYLHGGLYADMDVEVQISPFQHLPPGMVSVVGSPYPQNERHQNSMMASTPKHPFWRALVAKAADRRGQPATSRTTWQLTGPQLLDAVVDENPGDVHLLPAEAFNPPPDTPLSPGVFTRRLCAAGAGLCRAACSGNFFGVREAIEANADLECADCAGLTSLHHAALKGYTEIISLLVLARADVNSCDKYDTMPLHYAVQVSEVQAVQQLLEGGASTNGRLRSGACAGATPLDLAMGTFNSRPAPAGPAAQVLALLRSRESGRAPPRFVGRGDRSWRAHGPATTQEESSGSTQPWWTVTSRSSGPQVVGQPCPDARTPPRQPPQRGSGLPHSRGCCRCQGRDRGFHCLASCHTGRHRWGLRRSRGSSRPRQRRGCGSPESPEQRMQRIGTSLIESLRRLLVDAETPADGVIGLDLSPGCAENAADNVDVAPKGSEHVRWRRHADLCQREYSTAAKHFTIVRLNTGGDSADADTESACEELEYDIASKVELDDAFPLPADATYQESEPEPPPETLGSEEPGTADDPNALGDCAVPSCEAYASPDRGQVCTVAEPAAEGTPRTDCRSPSKSGSGAPAAMAAGEGSHAGPSAAATTARAVPGWWAGAPPGVLSTTMDFRKASSAGGRVPAPTFEDGSAHSPAPAPGVWLPPESEASPTLFSRPTGPRLAPGIWIT
mmetsp:Transcript_80206/g.227098  ORF Transcript_80206/g.227098 Transcript_80206/m.227098 type:complete len:762 (-) Transcript_80206:153-2438(-)